MKLHAGGRKTHHKELERERIALKKEEEKEVNAIESNGFFDRFKKTMRIRRKYFKLRQNTNYNNYLKVKNR